MNDAGAQRRIIDRAANKRKIYFCQWAVTALDDAGGEFLEYTAVFIGKMHKKCPCFFT